MFLMFVLLIFTGMSYIAGMFLMNMDEEVGLFDVWLFSQ